MKKRCAVFVTVYNEKYFLPLWVKYYSQFFGIENLYVLDHQSTDGGTHNLGCNVQVVKHKKLHDVGWLIKIAKEKQRSLLKDYEYVIHPDADEFIIPNPSKYKNLSCYLDYMKRNSIDAISCTGYEVIHQRHTEPILDWNKPILINQRNFWVNNDTFDKPIIGSRFINWTTGTHREIKRNNKRDNNLLLVHLHRVDFKTCKRTVRYKFEAERGYRVGSTYSKNHMMSDEIIESFDKPPHWNNPKHSRCILSKIPERYKGIV